jgi:hypothetical protein
MSESGAITLEIANSCSSSTIVGLRDFPQQPFSANGGSYKLLPTTVRGHAAKSIAVWTAEGWGSDSVLL